MAKHSLGGRTPLRGEKKEKATFSVTRKNLDTLQAIADILDLPSKSEVIEYLAEKEIKELQAMGMATSTEHTHPTHSAA